MSAVAEHQNEHGHHPYQAHHFHSMEQQVSAAKLGTWLFLGNELLFFSGIFMAYIYLRWNYPEMLLLASHHLDWKLGALNTVFLITSSLTMALAVREARLGDNRKVFNLTFATMLFALAFCVVKVFEYKAKIDHGLLPSTYWNGGVDILPGQPGPWLFYGLYFGATGLHAIHILIGVGLMIWVLKRARNNEFDGQHYAVVEGVGLYWHLVDLIWIFLFPLFYLVA